MKKALSLLIMSCLMIPHINGQIFTIESSSTQIDGELRPALHVTLEPDGKQTSKAFRSYLKDKHDIKLGWLGWKNRDAEEIKWNEVTGNEETINIYTQFKDLSKGSEFFVAIESKDGKFFSLEDNPQVMKQLKQEVTHFLSKFLPEYLNDQIEVVNDKISSLDKDLKKARGNYDKNLSDIKKNEKKIKKLQKENYEMKQENLEYQEEIKEKEDQNKKQHAILFEKREHLIKTKEKLIRQTDVE